MNTIFVTGGAGFIGSCLVRGLLAEQRPLRVVNLDKLTYAGNLDSLSTVRDNPRHVFIEGDTCDRTRLRLMLQEYRPAAVVHLAAESHVDRSIDGPTDFIHTNILGTFALLEAVREYWWGLPTGERERFRLVNVSTDEVYGSLEETGAFAETDPYAPNSPYAASKASADHLVRAYHHTYGLPAITTHCSNNYGPFQFPEKLIPLMILSAFGGRPLPIYGDGQNVRDWLHVEDHVVALCRVLDHGRPGEVYNIGGHCERTNREVVGAVCQLVDRICPGLPHAPCERLITSVPDRPGHDRRYALDTTKIERELGWRPRRTFEAGLEDTVRWYLEHGEWVQRVTSGTYRLERLGRGGSPSSK